MTLRRRAQGKSIQRKLIFSLRLLPNVCLAGLACLQSAIYNLKSEIAITFRNSSVRKERFAPGGKVYIRDSVPFHDRHCNEMGSTLDKNDNQDTGAFLALVHGRDHSSGPGIGATAEMLFQTRTRFVSKRRLLICLCLLRQVYPKGSQGATVRVRKGSQNLVGTGHCAFLISQFSLHI